MLEKRFSFEERLGRYPYLRSRFECILDVVEDSGGNIDKADEAEQLLIEEVRQLGKEALHDWAVGKEEQKVKELVKDDMKYHRKKNFGGTRPLER